VRNDKLLTRTNEHRQRRTVRRSRPSRWSGTPRLPISGCPTRPSRVVRRLGRGSAHVDAHAVAWLLDVFVLIVAAATLGVSVGGLPRCAFPSGLWIYGGNALLFLTGLLLSSYPGLLTEFLAFPMNIFRADAATTSFFVAEFLDGAACGPCWCRARWSAWSAVWRGHPLRLADYGGCRNRGAALGGDVVASHHSRWSIPRRIP